MRNACTATSATATQPASLAMSYARKRRTLHLPITLSVVLMLLNVVLMVCWIVLLAN